MNLEEFSTHAGGRVPEIYRFTVIVYLLLISYTNAGCCFGNRCPSAITHCWGSSARHVRLN